MKKTILLILSLFLIISLSGCNKKPVLKYDIHIFYTSDVHCGVDENMGFAGLKALVEDAKKEQDKYNIVIKAEGF